MRTSGRTRLFRALNTRPARRVCGRLSNWKVVPVAVMLFVSSGAVRADSWEVSYRSGVAAFELGRFDDARQRLDVALTTSNLDAHDVRRAEICAALASTYQALGEPIKAEIQFRAAEAIIESRPDAQSALRVDVLSGIGLLLLDQRQTGEALRLLEQALQVSNEVFGDQSLTTAMATARLALYYRDEGRLDAAESLLSRAMEVYRKIQPSRSAGWMMAETDLGVLYALQGRYSMAEAILRHATEIARGLGETHYLFGQSLNNLAYVYRLGGNAARGAPLLRRSLAIYESSLGSESEGVADVLFNMSNDAIADKKYLVAEAQITRALEIFAKVKAPDRVKVALAESRLAEVRLQQRKYSEAERLLKHALSIHELTSLEGQRVAGYCLYLWAELAKGRHQYSEAERNYQEAIAVYEKIAPVSPNLPLALQHYAELLKIDRRAESRALAMRAKDLQVALKSFK